MADKPPTAPEAADPGPRYTDRPLPAYRHLPGRTPHPTRNPAGHSYGLEHKDLPDLNRADWRDCSTYLYGIDLFNNDYWWECHEELEGLWIVARPGTPAAHAMQTVIQCAAAHLKAATDNPHGAMRLHDHSLRHAHWAGELTLGLDLDALVRDTRAFLTVAGAPPARLILNF